MARRASLLTALLLLAGSASAHDYPIKPVSVVLRVEPDRILADIDSDSIYWIEEVVGIHPMIPRDWPADALAKTEAYVNAHLRLNADGRRLPGRLVAASYVQRPWEVNEQGRFHLRMQYPPVYVSDALTLGGEADFFEDYRQERLKEKAPILPIQDFRTILTLWGYTTHRFELRPGSASFWIPFNGARLGFFDLLFNSVKTAALIVLTEAAGWPALAALALSLAPGAPSRRRTAALVAGTMLGASLMPGAAQNWLPWFAGAAAALAAGRWLGTSATLGIEVAAAAALGRYWAFEARPWLPSWDSIAYGLAAAALGILPVASLLVALGLLAADAERRRLTVLSESRAADLFERRRRLAATALLIVCAFGLSSRFPG